MTAAKQAKQRSAGAKAAKKPDTWADVMKQALQKKRPAAGFPDQPKPRDSGKPKVKKNSI